MIVSNISVIHKKGDILGIDDGIIDGDTIIVIFPHWNWLKMVVLLIAIELETMMWWINNRRDDSSCYMIKWIKWRYTRHWWWSNGWKYKYCGFSTLKLVKNGGITDGGRLGDNDVMDWS